METRARTGRAAVSKPWAPLILDDVASEEPEGRRVVTGKAEEEEAGAAGEGEAEEEEEGGSGRLGRRLLPLLAPVVLLMAYEGRPTKHNISPTGGAERRAPAARRASQYSGTTASTQRSPLPLVSPFQMDR
jgi:hypothetical protein